MEPTSRGARVALTVTVLALAGSTTAGCEYLFGTGGSATPRPTAAVETAGTSLPLPTDEAGSVVGVVLSVVGTSPTQITGFTLRTNDGERVNLEIGPLDLDNGFDAGHLREHQASAEPVRVDFIIDGGRRLAIRLNDA